MNPIKIVLADDQALVRQGLAALLDLEQDLQVVAQLPDGASVVEAIADHGADLAILDIEMPGTDGLAAAAQVSEQTQAKILILTTFGRAGYLQRALDAGAQGFMVKDSPAEELTAAIRSIMAGRTVVDPALAVQALTQQNPLTSREQDVLRATLTGRSVRDIAEQLHLSAGTVRNLLSEAISKTGSKNRAQAAGYARDQGWL
ncbi:MULTISPECIES: response regulator transcription factor [Auritidibacter]|uniref:response regulator transcription factor n=1 Tax=Auritidibacter TaxID=1160973 RepID=UPI000D72EFE8|nr:MULTISPECIES: response regulator transcription factor [Auritidibacter]AXR73079.1 DNA-binding response regulator [Auritidibacter sp. NML130574]NIH71512.1 two-component system response regulator DesR [Auritidibacter ignavus]PXA81833.1 DNA-binding response regulator [Auritidibacter sp. NML120636]RMX22506.1 DNA-binding response regulator [Auritidibacter ignavus]WGH81619.1 response regulator transcription factor [Auritidibacter ignavus]